MTRTRKTIPVVLALLLLAPSVGNAQSRHDLFQQALLQERAYGNLDQAADLYERIASEFPEDRALTATALVQLGSVYEKLGRSEARAVYLQVVRDLADQPNQVRAARERLTALQPAGGRRSGSSGIVPTYRLILDGMPVGRTDLPASYDFSPDGGQVVFRSHTTGERPPGLYVADSEGAVVRSLIVLDSVLGPTEGLWNPRWSPDGTRIAFTAHFPVQDEQMGLYVIDLDGGSVERIADSFEGDLCWTHDGSAVTHFGPDRRLYTRTVVGRTATTTLGSPLPQNTLLGGYSPDGTLLALDMRTERLGREMRDIWVMAADGTERFHVTDSPGLDADPVWSMDGGLYFVSDRSGNANIWKLGRDAITARRYPRTRGRSEPRSGRGWTSSQPEAGTFGRAVQVTFFDDERVVYPRGIVGGGVSFVVQNVTSTIQVAAANSPHESRTIARGRNPQLSPDGNRAYFENQGVGERGILSVRRDGGGLSTLVRNLSPGGLWSSRFAISPDGDALTYADAGEQGRGIFGLSIGRGPPRLITSLTGNDLSHPVWSPDGTRIAFVSGRGLYVVTWDSGQRTRLAELRAWDAWSVRWSPDGEYLAALGWGEPSGQVDPPNHIYVVPASGGELRQLTPDDERQHKEGLEWHPNGGELTYMYHTPDFEGDGLRTAYLDGRPTTLFIDEPATWDYIGTWAPDGSAYFFMASDRERPGWQLYRRDSDSGDVVEVFAGDVVSLPKWSRDGQTMTWSAEHVRSQLWMMEVEQ